MSVSRWALCTIVFVAATGVAQQGLIAADAGRSQNQEAPHQLPPGLFHRPPPPPGGKVKLDVVVTDKAGAPVSGLQQQDFTLLDNKKPQPILSFQEVDGATGNGTPSDPPVEVILLIDATNNSLMNVAYERSEVEKFLQQNGGHLAQPTTLIIFSEYGMNVVLQHSKDGNLMAQALGKSKSSLHTTRKIGSYDAIERFERSLKTLQHIAAREYMKSGRKMLIWIGPGWPTLEGPGYEQVTDTTQRELFDFIFNTAQALRDARITLYGINPEGGLGSEYYKSFLKGVASARQAQAGNLAMPVFAIHSGGLAFEKVGDLVRELNSCIADAKTYYTLGSARCRARERVSRAGSESG
jgi:VWFA-related protein